MEVGLPWIANEVPIEVLAKRLFLEMDFLDPSMSARTWDGLTCRER